MKQAVRIQTSVLNAMEKKALVAMAKRTPKCISSDHMTFLGFIGAVVIAVGYILSDRNINFLWLASAGLFINWIGDSMDGTGDLKQFDDPEAWIDYLNRHKNPLTVPEGRVPSTQFIFLREEDHKIIGMIDIRRQNRNSRHLRDFLISAK